MQTHTHADTITIKILANDHGTPPGKLADVEVHFGGDSVFAGLKLTGFSIWERRDSGRNVTFPARQYSVNGERRSFALLRPVVDTTAQHTLRSVELNRTQRMLSPQICGDPQSEPPGVPANSRRTAHMFRGSRTIGSLRFPIMIAGPSDHDGLDEVITMAGIRTSHSPSHRPYRRARPVANVAR